MDVAFRPWSGSSSEGLLQFDGQVGVLDDGAVEERLDLAGGAADARVRLGIYATGLVSDEEQDETSRETSSETTRAVGAVGIQLVSPNYLFGIGLDFVDEDTEFGDFETELPEGDIIDVGNSKQNGDEYGVQAFGTYFLSEYFFQGAARFALTDYEIRRVNLSSFDDEGGETPFKTRGDTDGFRTALFVGVGRIFRLTPEAAFALSGGIDSEYMWTDGYNEEVVSGEDAEDAETGALSFEDDDSISVTSVLETRATVAVELFGITMLPTVAGRYFHEFADNARTIDYSYPRANQSLEDDEGNLLPNPVSAETRTNNPDRNYFHLELGLGLPLGEQVVLEAAATTLLGHSFRDEESIAVGLRVTF
jgi:hypothetical protein